MSTKEACAEPTGDWPEAASSFGDVARWRQYTLDQIAFWKKFRSKQHLSSVMFLRPLGNKCVKYGNRTRLSEAAALQLVAEKSSVPIPKLYCAFEKDGEVYMLMERVKGKPLNEVWEKLSVKDREDIHKQLRRYFEELRKIPHPRPGTICAASADKLAVYDHRLMRGKFGIGPFEKEQDFNLLLRDGHERGSPGFDSDLETLIMMQNEKSHPICFTHGDARPPNIMVKRPFLGLRIFGKVKVVALIDFEMSGFFPDYWEYVQAMDNNFGLEYWKAELDKFLDTHPRDLEMDEIRLKYFSNLGYRG